jgi:hypothetical protein
LYFQSIADRRFGGIAKRNLKLFQSLCGDDPLKSVIVVTTMWDLLPPDDPNLGPDREQEMKTIFFAPIIEQGGRLVRHQDNTDSAQQIVSLLFDKQSREALAIQSEMVDHGRRLDQTTAAAELTRDFDAMIKNLKIKIKVEERLMKKETGQEREEMIEKIKGIRRKIKELEKRKASIQNDTGSLWAHMLFLRWVKAKFS